MDNSDPNYWIKLAIDIQEQNPYQAKKYYEKVLELDPSNYIALVTLSGILLNEGKFDKARDLLLIAYNSYSNDFAILTNLGAVYDALDNIHEAMYYYNEATKLNHPQKDKLWHNVGLLHRRNNDFKNAILCYDKSLEINPENVNTLYDKAFAHMQLNEIEAVEKCYDLILSIDPVHSAALGDKGTVLFLNGDYEGSINFFDRALKIDKNNSRIWKYKGDAHSMIGENEKAEECFKIANDLESMGQ
jgi:tetratricopeptide (TPR) repeat protein